MSEYICHSEVEGEIMTAVNGRFQGTIVYTCAELKFVNFHTKTAAKSEIEAFPYRKFRQLYKKLIV